MKKTFIAAVLLSMFSLSAMAAPGGASATAKGHGSTVKASAQDATRIKGAGGVSATAKGHGKTVSDTVKQSAKAAKAPTADPIVEAPVVAAPVAP